MGHRLRVQLEQANWHVTARGARRLLLFHEEADFRTFYTLLGESCRHTEMDLVADCLLSNHFHLSLGGGTSQLTACMQRLNRAYSGYHNDKYRLSGHAFEQRYYGEPILSDFILQRVVRYIHLNPVRAGRVSLPEDYAWSSYRRMIFASPASLGEAERSFLGLFDGDPGRAQKEYRAFTETDMSRKVLPATGKPAAWEIWQEQFTWFLEYLRQQEGYLHPLAPDSVAVHFGGRLGIPPRAMAVVLGHTDGRKVSEMKRQIQDRLEASPALRQRLDSLRLL